MTVGQKRLFLLDMDGTLYVDERLFDKVPEFLARVRESGGRYLFLTNNSSRGVEGYIEKLEDSCILLNRGVTWLATNPDWVCPTWYGSVPDCGSVCEMLTRATGRRPEFLGKPRPAMVQLALAETGFPPEQAVLIGDRLYTDIACGVNAGVDTALVLTGEATAADAAVSETPPTVICRDMAELLEHLQSGSHS